jgi:hypothetical protein
MRLLVELFLEQREDLFLVLNDGLQASLIFEDGRLVFLNRFLVSFDLTLVRKDGFLILQNLLLIVDNLAFGHLLATSCVQVDVLRATRTRGGPRSEGTSCL